MPDLEQTRMEPLSVMSISAKIGCAPQALSQRIAPMLLDLAA
jgi:hypothetical protein